MIEYNVVFDFRTYVDESIPDLSKIMKFVPFPGMNIWLEKDENEFTGDFAEGGWFKVIDVDYMMKEDLFIIALDDASQYDYVEESEN